MSSAAMGRADALERFEHDHSHLNQLVLDLTSLLDQLQTRRRPVEDIHPELEDCLDQLRDDLFLHFAHEEEGLFPFVTRELPDLAPAVAELASAHDAICGAVARMGRIAAAGAAALGAQLAAFVQLFVRFEAAYSAHAQVERALLAGLGSRLDVGQRQQLAEIVRGL